MRIFNALLFAAAAMAVSGLVTAPPVGDYAGDLGIGPSGKHRRGKGQNNRRGKGLRAKAKKRSNRLTISKRVRRKHRRAA